MALPLPLLALVAAVTIIFFSLAASEPGAVLARLGRKPLLLRLGCGGNLQPRVLGKLVTRQESTVGKYPTLPSFLSPTTRVAGSDTAAISGTSAGDRGKVSRLILAAMLGHGHQEGSTWWWAARC